MAFLLHETLPPPKPPPKPPQRELEPQRVRAQQLQAEPEPEPQPQQEQAPQRSHPIRQIRQRLALLADDLHDFTRSGDGGGGRHVGRDAELGLQRVGFRDKRHYIYI